MADIGRIRAAYDAFNARDVDALLELIDPDVEVEPLVFGVTTTGPWRGHDGIRRLLEDAQRNWDRFELRPDDFLEIGDRVVAFVHVTTAAKDGGPVVDGDIAHVLELRGDRLAGFTAYRDRTEAVEAAGG